MDTDFARIHVGFKIMQFRREVFGTWPPLMDHRHFNGPGVILSPILRTRVSSRSLSIDDAMVRAMVRVYLPSHDGILVTFK